MDANPIGLIIIGIAALIAIVVLMVTHWKQVSTFFKGLWADVENIFKNAWTFFNSGTGQWVSAAIAIFLPLIGIPLEIAEHWSSIVSFFSNLWGEIKGGFVDFVDFIIDGVNDMIKTILAPFNTLVGALNKIPGIKLPTISLAIPEIPKLAQGGIIDKPTIAQLGEAGI